MIDATTADARLRSAFDATGPHRTLHAKGTYATGTFTATARAAELGTAAHLQGQPVPVLVRFSNGRGIRSPATRRPTSAGWASGSPPTRA